MRWAIILAAAIMTHLNQPTEPSHEVSHPLGSGKTDSPESADWAEPWGEPSAWQWKKWLTWTSWLSRAMRWAIRLAAAIMSLSWGGIFHLWNYILKGDSLWGNRRQLVKPIATACEAYCDSLWGNRRQLVKPTVTASCRLYKGVGVCLYNASQAGGVYSNIYLFQIFIQYCSVFFTHKVYLKLVCNEFY